jgi:hydrogenase-1 operon protein HyaF
MENAVPLMNAPYLLNEIADALRALVETGETRTLYLSQFPLTDEDNEFLQDFLGHSGTIIHSHFASHSIWRESQTPGVWFGEYYDGPTTLVLQTIEIAPVPELAVPPHQDLRGSLEEYRHRLAKAIC